MLHYISYLSLWAFTLTNQSIKRIGFACKFSELNSKGEICSIKELNTGGTTRAWVNRQTRSVAEEKVLDVSKQNILHTHNLVKKVSSLEPALRMVRLTSDMLPFYTMDGWQDFWQDKSMQDNLARWFAPIGETARANDVRLSFHPDQFVVLASDREEVVNKSIEEFEYHVDMARMMGYGKQFQDIKINVHISGRKGPQGIRDVFGRLSPEARNTLTLENEEYTHGLLDCLSLSDLVPTVMDIHHNWIREGEYIDPTDDRVKRVIDSWRGVRPTMHYSVSREDILGEHSTTRLPNHGALIAEGHSKQKLRAHSDQYWNDAVNDWALTFVDNFDIMCESKWKNLASFKLFERYKNGII
jgi:UV DNA damage repair endonuclease